MLTVGTRNDQNRVAWLERTLAAIPAGSRILDAGAGELRFKPFCAHLDYVSQDFGKYDGIGDQVAQHPGKWDQTKLDIVSDITEIPSPDASFDAIMCVEVFEHIPDPVLAIKEFSRLLRPGGHLVLTAPFCSNTHFSPFHFSTGFNRYYYEHHLPRHGFEILEMTPNGNFFEFTAQLLLATREQGERYGGQRRRKWESLAFHVVWRLLQRYSDHGAKSAEMLCFGYHVRAVKK